MRTVTKISQLTVAAALGLSLAACGSSSSSGSSTSAAGATGAATSQPAPATGSATGGSDASSAAPSGDASGSSSPTSGGDEAGVPDAKTLVHQARAAYGSAKSTKLHADIAAKGEKEVFDITGTVDGSNQNVAVTTESDGSATFRTVDGKTYVKGDKAFWKTSSNAKQSIAAQLDGKWVALPASVAKDMGSITIKAILDSVMGPQSVSDAKLQTATTSKSTHDGQDAYVITSAKNGTITVTADKKLPVEINSKQSGSASTGLLRLTGWDQQDRVEAPDNPVPYPSSLPQ